MTGLSIALIRGFGPISGMYLVGPPAGASDIVMQPGAMGLRNAGAAPHSRECHGRDREEEYEVLHADVRSGKWRVGLSYRIVTPPKMSHRKPPLLIDAKDQPRTKFMTRRFNFSSAWM